MEVVIRYLEGCIAIGVVCAMLLVCIFIAAVVIARNNNKEEDRVTAVADVRLAYCLGPTGKEKAIKWFTTGKIYIVAGTHITDDQGHDWNCFYISDKKPHIKEALGYQFYIV